MKVLIDNLIIKIEKKFEGIQVNITGLINYILPNQTLHETKEVIEKNYHIVKSHYIHLANQGIDENDIYNICLKIVLYYFSMYNQWRKLYKREKNRNLIFLEKDFNNSYTNDIIINYFRKKYQADFENKCAVFLGFTHDEFVQYFKERMNFNNMF